MKIRDLCEEVEEIKNPKTEVKLKDKFHMRLKDLFSILQQYQDSDEMKKENIQTLETLKDMIFHIIKKEEDKQNERV